MTTTIGTPLLPKETYLEQHWFDREQELIFNTSWAVVGLTNELPEAGDYITGRVGRYPLVVIRGADGELRAFHNTCRHRGTQLLRATGKKRAAINCPYHNWSYSIEGKLISVPQRKLFDEAVLDTLALHPAAIAEWNGIVFVHPSATPPETLDDWLGDFPNHFGPHTPLDYEMLPTDVHEWAANWKIVVENYVDGYHLFHLHADTLNMYDHAKAETSFHNRHFAFYEPPVDEYRSWLDGHRDWQLPGWSPDRYGAWVHMLYPATGLTGTELSWSIFQVTPLAPDRTRVEIRSWARPGAAAWAVSQGEESAETGGDPLRSGDFMEEDRYACEQQQKGMTSPHFAVGATSRGYEDSVLGFQRNWASALGIDITGGDRT